MTPGRLEQGLRLVFVIPFKIPSRKNRDASCKIRAAIKYSESELWCMIKQS